MVGIYFLLMAVLVVAAFFIARRRAAAVGASGRLHSLPSYHGLLASSAVLLPMVATMALGWPLTGWLAETSALSILGPDLAADATTRGAALRDVVNVAAGQFSGTPSAELSAAAVAYQSTRATGGWAILGIGGVLGLLAILWATTRISLDARARNLFERVVTVVLLGCATVAVLTTIGIVASVMFETYRFFFDPEITGKPTVTEFLFGLDWNPQSALRADQGDFGGSFGFVPLLTGTLLITAIAICVAGPIGLFSAIYLSEYASRRTRAFAKPLLEILAGVPTVVLGFFAALTVAPFIRDNAWVFSGLVFCVFVLLAAIVIVLLLLALATMFGADEAARLLGAWSPMIILAGTVAWLVGTLVIHGRIPPYDQAVASESALAAGLVMGMMIIPFISSLSDDVINAVPQALRDGAFAMGATKSEAIRQVVLPAALPGIVSAFMLAISRAIGETMIVVMAAGLAANLTLNPLEAVTTITVQIKTILVGDQEFNSAKTLAAFALGFSLFFITLALNFIALRVVQKYREQYD